MELSSRAQQESLPDEVARQQIHNTALEERRQALRAELVKDGVSLNADKEPIHCSGMTCKQSHVPTDQNRGRKRKHDEAGGEDGATTGPWGEGCEQVVNDELAGAREDSESEAPPQRASSSGGDDCEGADDESSEEDEEETISDREMFDNHLQQIDSAHDHRLVDQEREIGADEMAIAARVLVERGYVVFSATTQWDPESKDKKGGKIMRPPSNWPETTLANCLSQYFDPHQNTLQLGKFCRDHGLEGPGRPSELRFVDAGHQFRGYRGFKLNESTPNSRLER